MSSIAILLIGLMLAVVILRLVLFYRKHRLRRIASGVITSDELAHYLEHRRGDVRKAALQALVTRADPRAVHPLLLKLQCERDGLPGVSRADAMLLDLATLLERSATKMAADDLTAIADLPTHQSLRGIDTMRDYPPYDFEWELDRSRLKAIAQQELKRRQDTKGS